MFPVGQTKTIFIVIRLIIHLLCIEPFVAAFLEFYSIDAGLSGNFYHIQGNF